MIRKILKNESGSDIFILTRTVSDQNEYEVPARLWDQLMDDEDVIVYITAGDIIVNNGTQDLSPIDGEAFVRRFQEDPNPTSMVGKLYCLTFTKNASAQNKWLELGDGCNTNSTWAVLPFKSKLIATSVSNSNSGADFDIRLHKSDFNSGASDTYITWDLPNNVRTASKNDWSGIEYNSGTKIGIYCADQGKNPKDVVFTMWLQILDEDIFEDFEDFSGNF